MSIFSFKEIKSLDDLSFTVACLDICISPNGKKMITSGIYKPSLKLFDLKSGVMRFERHLVSDPVKNFFLDDDGEKFAILRNDKTIEFHIKGGLHDRIRTINQPKDAILNKFASEIYIGGNYGEINRFNLEQGRFMKSIPCAGAERMSFSNVHGLLGAIAKNNVSFIDPRSKDEIFSKLHDEEIYSICQDESGLKYALGTESGHVLEYDLRSTKTIRSLECDNFISKICYSGKNIIANSSKQIYFIDENVKIADEATVINPGFIINAFCIDGGAIFIGGENEHIKTYISEDAGTIPEWIFDTRDL
jgi:ribosome biogenesis protein ENP2